MANARSRERGAAVAHGSPRELVLHCCTLQHGLHGSRRAPGRATKPDKRSKGRNDLYVHECHPILGGHCALPLGEVSSTVADTKRCTMWFCYLLYTKLYAARQGDTKCHFILRRARASCSQSQWLRRRPRAKCYSPSGSWTPCARREAPSRPRAAPRPHRRSGRWGRAAEDEVRKDRDAIEGR